MSDSAVTPVDATFDQFGLAPDILKAIADQGYTKPTPIQAKAIPVVLSGRDVMGAAQTGTGKTASFSLPIIQRLLPQANTSASPARHPVRALILTPTRELADQVAANVHSYAKHTALRSAVVFGGVDMNPQMAELRRGVEILIATPGRLLDHVQQKTANLGQVQMLVLDEADRMLDMGFLPDLQRILNLLPKARQTLLFSATFSPEIKKLAATYLTNPQTIEVARSNATATNVTQIVYDIAEGDKQAAVVKLIRDRALKQVIVFCNSKIGASRLARLLERDGVVATAIHGDRSQNERMQALEAFKRGEVEALVATDVAARGLDIAELPAVINFDLPFSAEDYVHRIGRTGRAGASGDALSLCSPNERKQLADIEKLIKRDLPLQPLAIEAPVRMRREHGERSERGSRDEARAPRRAHGGERGHHHHSRREAPVDEFFLKPYEPSPSARQPEEASKPAQTEKKSKQPLAALLGGFGMPRRSS
ncbi:DEAD/DEAH box helicase [Burkholderia glumae]|uniref:DEAD-box ATP-dependent RNA helicase RhpA n=2 Tax=Burkholderia glumae TaxID=337 RepID=A0AAP9Y2S0_BURGL|nr:DEAD/DEAH box helicase [Burkholderia glumae]ACR29732.1 Putative ATP-dependent RNA helicase 2 [Burkholderia glumae BGR1]AJY67163.1 DEAD/DEAH box helicase family protein [Burkholderia glumae LMG 2196 = ATCC 33617]MCM2482599.1 DEAD/DEAH box helicase [Burkholderia glumae]MCM2507259.1 DEAD/DEAH box helicase [Burkholderia glumae]MCM2538956.1 DEAD/DEAH box helicase [Burkholderia glumae]